MKRTLLMILDGWGIGKQDKTDAIFSTPTPFIDGLSRAYPHTQLYTSGENVGLPDGQMGNSEVGHLNIGAGRVVLQDLVRINKACRENTILQNPEIVKAFTYAREKNKQVHFMGLVSDGGVHSSLEHLKKLCDISKEYNIEKTFVHCFMDGRDTDPRSGLGFIKELKEHMAQSAGRIASVIGRYYAMDRDNRWERVEKAYAAMVYGEGVEADCPICAVQNSYDQEVTDEFVVPTVCKGAEPIQAGDSIIFYNFRPDRAREITRTFVDPDFSGFERKNGFFKVNYVCTTSYDASMPNVVIAFPKESLQNIFGEYISQLGLTQLRIAETEKYAHVTFFFNGGVETVFPGEDRVLIPSPKVPTYDLKPDMSAREVAAEAVKRIESGEYDVIILNFANCDMVGHTGVYEAARLAVETVDECVSQVVEATQKMGGVALITADHGNADRMLEDDGETPYTAHTTNLVPFYIVGANVKLRDGKLCDIAPTMLDLMGLQKPKDMTGETLIES